MSSKKFSCKFKKVLSAVLAAVMVAVMFAVLTVSVPMTASAATATTQAIFIGSTTRSIACAFIPLNIAPESTSYYKRRFFLSGKQTLDRYNRSERFSESGHLSVMGGV